MTATNIALAGMEAVRDAVLRLHNEQKAITYETIMAETGLRAPTIKERLDDLLDEGFIVRVSRGLYEPCVRRTAPRAVSVTVLPDGTTKVEIGDGVLDLQPAEATLLARAMGTAAHDMVSMQAHREVLAAVALLNGKVLRMANLLNALRRKEAQAPQVPLPLDFGQ